MTLAVLPIENLGGDSTVEYLADAMTGELANALKAMPGLQVVAPRARDDFDIVEVEPTARSLPGGCGFAIITSTTVPRAKVEPSTEIMTMLIQEVGVLISRSGRAIALAVLCTLASGCKKDSTSPNTGLAGKWTGASLQPKTSGNTEFDFSMDLTINGSTVTGTSHINVLNLPQYYADFTVTGTATATTVDITETRITAQVPPNTGGSWCLIHATLTLSSDGRTLAGPWTASGCAPGTLSLTRG